MWGTYLRVRPLFFLSVKLRCKTLLFLNLIDKPILKHLLSREDNRGDMISRHLFKDTPPYVDERPNIFRWKEAKSYDRNISVFRRPG